MTGLVEILKAHLPVDYRSAAGLWCQTCLCQYTDEAEFAAHVVAVIAAAKLAVVELPEPYPDETIYPYWSVEDVNGPQVVGVTESDDDSEHEWVSIQFSARWRTVDAPTARALGLALLAAAAEAESPSVVGVVEQEPGEQQ